MLIFWGFSLVLISRSALEGVSMARASVGRGLDDLGQDAAGGGGM